MTPPTNDNSNEHDTAANAGSYSDSHDSGHSDSHAESMRPSYDDVNTPVIVLIGVISMVLTFLTIWFVQGLFYNWKAKLVRERNYDVANPIQADIINSQKAMLDGVEERKIESLKDVIGTVVNEYKSEAHAPEDHEIKSGEAHKQSKGH